MQTLKGIARKELGSRPSCRARAAGLVPGIIYGHGGENVPFATSGHSLALLLSHGERLVEMELDGEKANYLIKNVQRDAFDHEVIHVDFTRVSLDETVELTVPVVLRGTPAGETDGGVLTPGVTEIIVTCMVTNIPDEIRVRVNDLKLGDTLRVKDLPAIEGGTILTDGEAMVASCQLVAEEVKVEEPAEGEVSTEPEVIGKRDEESAESSEQ